MERVIAHLDINHCYAQIEEMKFPELKEVPMAVGGHEEDRHGIILAKNDKCKAYGVKTGESLLEARKKCPNIVVVPPNYDDYLYYCNEVKQIYREYSDKVESFGLDEAWVDITDSIALFGSKEYIIDTIRRRVKEELGLDISVGVSYNKIFAKLGSDLAKKTGVIYITKENFKEQLYHRDVSELLYVGRATSNKLKRFGILTIGELANTPEKFIQSKLGKMGQVIQSFARGEDISEVMLTNHTSEAKSIGNGITTKRDMSNLEETMQVFYVLCESVAARMREAHVRGYVVSIGIRNNKLEWITRQRKMDNATNVAEEIIKVVEELVKENVDFQIPLRGISISMSKLVVANGYTQLNLFEDEQSKMKVQKLEETMDYLRNKYGFDCIKRCSLLLYEDLTSFNPKGDHVIHPVGFF